MTDSKKTVIFNVGGKHFEVARSTLDKYQDSMLTRLASDTWDGNKDEPIFVDASSDHFEFVLEYMRHNKVNVPMSISREAVMDDLEYFCLPFEESQITVSRKRGSKRLVTIQKEISDYEKTYSESTTASKPPGRQRGTHPIYVKHLDQQGKAFLSLFPSIITSTPPH